MSSLSKAEQDLKARARELAETKIQPRAAEIDETQEYPWDHVERLTKAGFMGMTIPP
ncbi:MAG: acyl-CoA dehydrogenase family protein, partial [Alphaproteobacteria bacterium]|nr:acyl-CoA dehydrogenase family protein [Alphaproteobacteria bacterium]